MLHEAETNSIFLRTLEPEAPFQMINLWWSKNIADFLILYVRVALAFLTLKTKKKNISFEYRTSSWTQNKLKFLFNVSAKKSSASSFKNEI